LLPIILPDLQVDALFKEIEASEGAQLSIDLQRQVVIRANGDELSFAIDAFRKHCLLNGLDDIDLTLQQTDAIKTYEAKRSVDAPWLFNSNS
jgi:3-isopropylmalate/(R)-2-methylmalate dehydratase small subunit